MEASGRGVSFPTMPTRIARHCDHVAVAQSGDALGLSAAGTGDRDHHATLPLVTPTAYLGYMFASSVSVALVGVEPQPVRVEVHVAGTKQLFIIVGLPDTAVREAKERVRSALNGTKYDFPNQRVTVNLAPADIPKVGSAYDLPIALGVLAAQNEERSEFRGPWGAGVGRGAAPCPGRAGGWSCRSITRAAVCASPGVGCGGRSGPRCRCAGGDVSRRSDRGRERQANGPRDPGVASSPSRERRPGRSARATDCSEGARSRRSRRPSPAVQRTTGGG